MNNKKINKKKVFIVLLCIIAIVFFCMAIRNTFSRYQSESESQAEPSIAFWLVTDTVQETNVILEDLEPGATKECVFSVSNNNGTVRTDTAIEYKISVSATTNLPLTYELYTRTNNEDTICEKEEEQLVEEDGVFYKEFIVSGFELGHKQNETVQFVLKTTFLADYTDSQLADLLDCVNLKIEAKQKISE